MLFRETSMFTAQVSALLDDDAYANPQAYLRAHPDAGAVIRGSGGARKVRWARTGGGKRSGVRVIYAHLPARSRIYFPLIYAKSGHDDLTSTQLRILAGLLRDD